MLGSRPPFVLLVCSLLAATACSPDQTGPAGPSDPPEPGRPEMPGEGIPLTIDVATGTVTVGALPASDDGLSHSLLGSDVIDMQAGDCTFSPVPGNNKLIRCTFPLTIRNKLSDNDLVTPTTFPRPPQGVDGLLVFPYASGAVGVNGGGTAVPSPDWDEQPVNFFNDLSGCTKSANDCYRWERFDAPLGAGDASETHTVGFDIPKSAQSVGVYIVVAADLAERQEYEVVLEGVPGLDGEFAGSSFAANLTGGGMRVGTELFLVVITEIYEELRGFAGFDLTSIPADAEVLSAELRLHQVAAFGGATGVLVDHIAMGDALDLADFGTAMLAEPVPLASEGEFGLKLADVTAMVAADVAAGRATSGYRLRATFQVQSERHATFATAENNDPELRPTLVVRYR